MRRCATVFRAPPSRIHQRRRKSRFSISWKISELKPSMSGCPERAHASAKPYTHSAANVNAPVNVRRIRLAASDEVMAFHLARVLVRFADQAVFPGTDVRALKLLRIRLAFDEDFDFAALKVFGN